MNENGKWVDMMPKKIKDLACSIKQYLSSCLSVFKQCCLSSWIFPNVTILDKTFVDFFTF